MQHEGYILSISQNKKRGYPMKKVVVFGAAGHTGIAQCMADMIEDAFLGVNESLGITN